MNKIISLLIILSLFSCKNEGNYAEAPSSWISFEKSNTSGIGYATIKFKYPGTWVENEVARTDPYTKYLIAFPQSDTSSPNIIINTVFTVNMDKTFDEFVDSLIMPTLNGYNKQTVKLNNYSGYTFDLPSYNGDVSKSYIINNERNPIFIVIRGSNKEIFNKKIDEAESIVKTIVIH